METDPTTARKHGGSSLSEDDAPPLRDSSKISSCILSEIYGFFYGLVADITNG